MSEWWGSTVLSYVDDSGEISSNNRNKQAIRKACVKQASNEIKLEIKISLETVEISEQSRSKREASMKTKV